MAVQPELTMFSKIGLSGHDKIPLSMAWFIKAIKLSDRNVTFKSQVRSLDKRVPLNLDEDYE